MMTADSICAALPSLSATELNDVYSRIMILRSLSTSKDRNLPAASDDEAKLYSTLREDLLRTTGDGGPPYHVFQRTPAYKDFHAAADHALELTRVWFPKAAKVQRFSLFGLYASLILTQLREAQRPLAWYRVVGSLHNLESVVESCFPGYYASGLLAKVLESRIGSRTNERHESHPEAGAHA